MNILYIAGTIIGTVTGQMFIKYGVNLLGKTASTNQLNWIQYIIRAVFNGYIFFGFVLAFAASLCWIFAMRTLPLSTAYPFTALNIIIATLFGYFFFQETLPPYFIVSMLLILSGLLLLGSKTFTTI